MTKRERPEKWPKNIVGTRLAQFGSTVILVQTAADWNAAVSYIRGEPISKIDPRKLVKAEDDCVGASTYYSKSDRKATIFIVGVFDGSATTLVHEIGHTVFHICGYYGIPTNAGDSNEFYCYMLDFLYSELSKCLIRANDATPTA